LVVVCMFRVKNFAVKWFVFGHVLKGDQPTDLQRVLEVEGSRRGSGLCVYGARL
jgi:hypothetical protein